MQSSHPIGIARNELVISWDHREKKQRNDSTNRLVSSFHAVFAPNWHRTERTCDIVAPQGEEATERFNLSTCEGDRGGSKPRTEAANGLVGSLHEL